MTQLFNKFYIPEDVGISSVAIAQFLKECDEINYKLRTLHIVRHDKSDSRSFQISVLCT